MRPRTAAVLLAIAFLLGAFVAFYELGSPGEQAPEAAEAARLFPGARAEQIDAIELIGREGRQALAERRDDGWWLVEPVDFDGDDATLDGIAATLAGLVAEARIVPRVGSKLGEFGLDPAERELRFRADGDWRSLRVGRRTPVGGNTYVGVGAGSEVFSIQSWRANGLARSVDELRNRRVLHFDPPTVRRLRAAWPGGEVSLERRDEGWWLSDPVQAPADADAVDGLLSDLSFLRADGFVDEPAADADLGLEAPSFSLSLSGAGLELEFALGEERGGRRVARGARGALYAVASERIEDFPRELVAWRDKSLARFEPADAGRLEIVFSEPTAETQIVAAVRGPGGWQDEAGSLSPQRVGELVAELARLAGVDIVAESLGEGELAGLGLRPPRVRLRVFAAGAAPGGAEPVADVSLGSGDRERGVFAQRADSSQVFRIAAEVAEQLPLSRTGWQEGFGAASDEFGETDEMEAAEEADPGL